ncbi:MAG: 30S ribosomal protein S8 [Parcubacteria group bacterium]|nr:30S ribosomal protein S8 [Parcubacteria group bacterium]
MNDPIADMITRIKNAGEAEKESLLLPYSKLKLAIAELLQKEGYLKDVTKKGKKITNLIEIGLIYEDGMSRIKGAERVSKFSRRVYHKAKDIKKVKQGFGMLVLTTPKGIMGDKQAKKENVGGEVLFRIW